MVARRTRLTRSPTSKAKPVRVKSRKPFEIGRVVYERSGRWWIANMPSFPGAYTQGRTRDEATLNLMHLVVELIEVYLEGDQSAHRPRHVA